MFVCISCDILKLIINLFKLLKICVFEISKKKKNKNKNKKKNKKNIKNKGSAKYFFFWKML